MFCLICTKVPDECDSEEDAYEGRAVCFGMCALAGPGAENKIIENQKKQMNLLPLCGLKPFSIVFSSFQILSSLSLHIFYVCFRAEPLSEARHFQTLCLSPKVIPID